jgi:hypothetical protein
MGKYRFLSPVVLAAIGLLSGCASLVHSAGSWSPYSQDFKQDHQAHWAILRAAAKGQAPGAVVLATAQGMLDAGEVIVGSCWDFIDTVFTRAGFKGPRLASVYSKPYGGPFADVALIQAGDWLMYQNLSYGDIDHSAIFVAWIDVSRNRALTVSYVGENRLRPGRLFEYDLSRTYQILRPRLAE